MDMVERGDMLSKDDVLDILAVDLIGIVPDDEYCHFHKPGRTIGWKQYTSRKSIPEYL